MLDSPPYIQKVLPHQKCKDGIKKTHLATLQLMRVTVCTKMGDLTLDHLVLNFVICPDWSVYWKPCTTRTEEAVLLSLIQKETGDRNGEDYCYANLGAVYLSLANYGNARYQNIMIIQKCHFNDIKYTGWSNGNNMAQRDLTDLKEKNNHYLQKNYTVSTLDEDTLKMETGLPTREVFHISQLYTWVDTVHLCWLASWVNQFSRPNIYYLNES